MTYLLSIATPEGRDLVVTALRQASDQRTRVARGAARKVAEAKAAKRDVRSQAVKVTDLLAEADVLAELATELERTEELVILHTSGPGVTAIPIPEPPTRGAAGALPLDDEEDPEDDGLSAAAHRAAELAGLEDTVIDPDDPTLDTGATAEDDEDEPAEVNL